MKYRKSEKSVETYSNQDIEEIISKDKSCAEKSISDIWNEDLLRIRSDGGSASPYVSDYADMEPPVSINSTESHERNSEVIQKFDEDFLNPVSIFNDDFDESLPRNSDPLIDNLFEESNEDHGSKIVGKLLLSKRV